MGLLGNQHGRSEEPERNPIKVLSSGTRFGLLSAFSATIEL